MKRFVKCFFCFINALPILSDRNIHLFVLYFILTIFKVGVNVKTKVMRSILLLFLLCSIVEYFEFLLIRTDQTFLAENVLCKLFILLLIFLVLRRRQESLQSIGFRKDGFFKGALLGLSLGISSFAISYAVEYIVLRSMGQTPSLKFFISNFALQNQNITGVSLTAIGICIVGNVLNVLAEEGLFRGLFLHLGKTAFAQRSNNLLQALLFGVWHIVMVVGWVIDGSMNVPAAIAMAVGYVLLAGILGYEWGLCVQLTGTLWAGIFEHFFNNFLTNSLHMVTASGIDELQILRIVLSNILSLTFVLLLTKRDKAKVAAQ